MFDKNDMFEIQKMVLKIIFVQMAEKSGERCVENAVHEYFLCIK